MDLHIPYYAHNGDASTKNYGRVKDVVFQCVVGKSGWGELCVDYTVEV
jgi:hypothetical protein